MLTHPQFDPIALSLGPIAIRWYGLMYVIAFALFWWLGRSRIKAFPERGFTMQMLDDLLFYGVLGVILGGRLGYIIFYKPGYYLSNPLEIFYVWQGGMSFHGGFLGVLVAMVLIARKYQMPWLKITDFIAPLVPTGLAAGRMGNFINGELPGRIVEQGAIPWAMWFPQVDRVATLRHPSQLYQFLLEGLALFFILWWFSKKPRPLGVVSAVFLIGYGAFRFIAEFGRQPDDFLGLLAMNLSMGQWLSLPMIIAGIAMLIWANRQAPAKR
ncbi:MAG: prolipoprotein diacylglyceryl transferase [Betaproteobacteria bacterium]|nr:prolipoprotein diacylglyceryl transferase [Betaproteobacteria bacterium]